MRRLLTGVLAVAILASLFQATPATARPKHWVPRWWKVECRFQKLDDHGGFTVAEVDRTIRCATDRWDVPGGYPEARCIADRESGLRPDAQNPRSSAAGIFQIVAGTWAAWTAAFARRAAQIGAGRAVLNARDNVLHAVWAMNAYGLGPWRGGC